MQRSCNGPVGTAMEPGAREGAGPELRGNRLAEAGAPPAHCSTPMAMAKVSRKMGVVDLHIT